jgi:hypothetical protein
MMLLQYMELNKSSNNSLSSWITTYFEKINFHLNFEALLSLKLAVVSRRKSVRGLHFYFRPIDMSYDLRAESSAVELLLVS